MLTIPLTIILNRSYNYNHNHNLIPYIKPTTLEGRKSLDTPCRVVVTSPCSACTRARVRTHGTVHSLKPGVHTNDFAPIYGRRANKLGHASLTTVFRPSRLTLPPIIRENLESPVIRYQPITTAVVTDACLNTRWHHGAYTPAALSGSLGMWFSRRNERGTVATRFARDSSVGS